MNPDTLAGLVLISGSILALLLTIASCLFDTSSSTQRKD